jgi:beta-lactamase regulating signal transducer with metallopeptidase domain
VYHVFLEKEKMHLFNRYYLLLSLAFSLIIPLVKIEVAGENLPLKAYSGLQAIASLSAQRAPIVPTAAVLPYDMYQVIWWVYASVAILLLYRFAKNLVAIFYKTARQNKVECDGAKLVLMNEPTAPHSFLQYIFVNGQDYTDRKIAKELIMHELAHVRQKHSIDILFMELLLIVFWCNPLLYFYRKAIKLNHEFLADDYAVGTAADAATYQYLLLNTLYARQHSPLICTLNYSLTKKRLMMMTKTSSPVQLWLKKAAMVPLLFSIFLAFSTEMLAQKPVPGKKVPASKEADKETVKLQQEEMYYGNVTMAEARDAFYNNEEFHIIRKNDKGEYVKNYYKDLTAAEIAALPDPPQPPAKKMPSQGQLNDWLDSAKYGIWLDDKQVDNKVLKKYKPVDIAKYDISRLHKNAVNYGKHYFQINLYTQQGFANMRAEWLARFGIKE